MSRSVHAEKSDGTRHLATPVIKRNHWPFILVWIVPICAAALAGYYFFGQYKNRGALLTLKVNDATSLEAGQSQVMHLGVSIGVVEDVQLSSDQKQAILRLRLKRSADSFAKKGAEFWIVRPEISVQEISGLGTVLSGPFINCNPGSGATQTEFTALPNAPVAPEDGLRIVLKASNVKQMQTGSPIYFRGIQVGVIEAVQLSNDAASVELHAFIRRHYAVLVRENSQFWVISAVDLKGSIFTGVQMKVDSLRSLLSSGIGFADPDKEMGVPAKDGAGFILHDEPDKQWEQWAPTIDIGPDESEPDQMKTSLPEAPPAIRSAVGP